MSTKIIIALLIIFLTRLVLLSSTNQEGKSIYVSGIIFEDPIQRGSWLTFNLNNYRINLQTEEDIYYGDYVEVEGIYKDKIVYSTKLTTYSRSDFFLFNVREKILNFFRKSLPEPHAALVSGMVLGAKSDLDEASNNSLRLTGTSHVVVASGMNVALVGGFLFSVFNQLFTRKKALIFALLGILFYVLLAGLQPPIIRAALMLSCVYLAQISGKIVSPVRLLVFVALIMLCVNPAWVESISFQLSFTATLSLTLFTSFIDSKISFVPQIFREGFSTSLAAQVGVAPLIFVHFGSVSIISPFVNALVLWVVPYITILGMLLGLIALIIPGFAQAAIVLVYPFTWWFWSTINLFV